MPGVSGILETALYVEDLDRSELFYQRLFGRRTKLSDERMRAISIADGQMLLLFRRGQSVRGTDTPRGHIPGHDGAGPLHVAFRIEPIDLDAWQARLAELGIEIISHVCPEQGGDSLYFHDPDGHVVELATATIWDLGIHRTTDTDPITDAALKRQNKTICRRTE